MGKYISDKNFSFVSSIFTSKSLGLGNLLPSQGGIFSLGNRLKGNLDFVSINTPCGSATKSILDASVKLLLV